MMTTNQTLPSAPLPHGFVALVVDHDPASRLNLCGLIESEGGQAIEAHNGTAALSAIRERRPDIVLIDATSSETSGFDACEQIQALPHGSDTPVLMMIAFDDDATVNLALAVGAADYVTKPIRPVVLRQRIRRLLQAHYTDVAILRAKKEWETAVDAVSDMVILTDLKGRIIRCNLATIQTLQTTYSKLIGKNLENALLENSGRKLDLTFGQPHEMQFPALPGWYEVRAFHGQLGGRWHSIVYILKGITERKQLEEELRQSDQRSRSLTENIKEGIRLYDAGGKIIYFNPTDTRLTGNGQEILGESALLFGHSDDIPQAQKVLVQLMGHPAVSDAVSTVVEKNSAAVEEVSASAAEMSAQVEEVTASAESLEMAQTLRQLLMEIVRAHQNGQARVSKDSLKELKQASQQVIASLHILEQRIRKDYTEIQCTKNAGKVQLGTHNKWSLSGESPLKDKNR